MWEKKALWQLILLNLESWLNGVLSQSNVWTVMWFWLGGWMGTTVWSRQSRQGAYRAPYIHSSQPILQSSDLDFLNQPPLRDQSLALNAIWVYISIMTSCTQHGSVRISLLFDTFTEAGKHYGWALTDALGSWLYIPFIQRLRKTYSVSKIMLPSFLSSYSWIIQNEHPTHYQAYPCLDCKALQFASEFSPQTVGGNQTIQSG